MSSSLSQYPLETHDKIRYADTDRQGHVNNAVFATFLETGRTEFLYNEELKLLSPDCSWVIASLQIDFKQEIHWPGEVKIKTGIKKLGNSSLHLEQVILQNESEVAQATTVIVHVSNQTKKSIPLEEEAKVKLESYLL